jgi:2-dehydro-3-deoxy-D-arabinonate dehydratase
MSASALWKVGSEEGPRLARGPVDAGPEELLPPHCSLDRLLAQAGTALAAALEGPADGPVPEGSRVLAPLGTQEIWAAGVTYERSRAARQAESQTPDHYDRVYDAERPELFFKAASWRVRGPGEPIAVRGDSTWDVPEPELAVVADAAGRVVAFTLGNDVSSRSIEGENPLYLPQAKVYTGSCAVGPCLVPIEDAPPLHDMVITLEVRRDADCVVRQQVNVADLRRSPDELVAWLFRALDFPVGAVLLTGTATVPDPEFSLQPGDEVRIAIAGIGELRNPTELVSA